MCGTFGYLGFLESTDGNILNNFSSNNSGKFVVWDIYMYAFILNTLCRLYFEFRVFRTREIEEISIIFAHLRNLLPACFHNFPTRELSI